MSSSASEEELGPRTTAEEDQRKHFQETDEEPTGESSGTSDDASSATEDDSELDEEDLELLAENMGTASRKRGDARLEGLDGRPKKTFKRIKRRRAIESDDDDAADVPADSLESAPRGQNMLETLFDQEDEQELASGGELEDEDDFIVDDDAEDDFDERGRGAARVKHSVPAHEATREPVKASRHRRSFAPSAPAGESGGSRFDSRTRQVVEDMADIFGAEDDLEEDVEAYGDELVSEERPLDEVFEPSLLEAHYLTPEDALIRSVDLPERFQLRDGSERGFPGTEDELMKETVWVANAFLKTQRALNSGDGASGKVLEGSREFLKGVSAMVKWLREEALEVPFLYTHRKDYFKPARSQHLAGAAKALNWSMSDLWQLYDLDGEWKMLVESRDRLLVLIDKLLAEGSTEHEDLADTGGGDSVVSRLRSWKEKLATGIQEMERSDLDAIRTSCVSYKKKLAAHQPFVAPWVGISTTDMGKNVADHLRRTEPIDPDTVHPTLEAELSSGEEGPLLSAVAEEWCLDPNFQRGAVGPLLDMVLVTVTPEAGKPAPSSPPVASIPNLISQGVSIGALLTPLEWIAGKPLGQISPEQYGILLEGERLGLCKIELSVALDEMYTRECVDLVTSIEHYGSTSQRWNAIRCRIMTLALQKAARSWLPVRAREAKAKITKYIIREQMTEILMKKLFMAGILPKSPVEGNDLNSQTQGCILAVGNLVGKQYRGVLVTATGQSVGPSVVWQHPDQYTSHFLPYYDQTTEKHKKIVIVTASRLVKQAMEKAGSLVISFLEDDLAQLVYQDSLSNMDAERRSPKGHLQNTPYDSGYLASLARRAVDPLTEFCHIALQALPTRSLSSSSGGKQSLLVRLRLHALDGALSGSDRQTTIERALMHVAAIVGNDINASLKSEWAASSLPFLPGLGPRKAEALVKAISGQTGAVGGVPISSSTHSGIAPGYLVKRADLLANKWLGKRVFWNVASFLRIQESSFPGLRTSGGRLKSRAMRDAFEILDSTRIHPEHYDLARKMAADALDIEEESSGTGGSSWQITQILADDENRGKLRELLLDDYSIELERSRGIQKRSILYMIRDELIQGPYHEVRHTSAGMTEEEMATCWSGNMTTMELPWLCPPGKPVAGVVVACRPGSWLKLRLVDPPYLSAFSGMVFASHNSSGGMTYAMMESMGTKGQALTGTLDVFQADRALVMLRDLARIDRNAPIVARPPTTLMFPPMDPYYDMARKELVAAQQRIPVAATAPLHERVPKPRSYQPPPSRHSRHPLYKAADRLTVEHFLAQAGAAMSPVIFRPSSSSSGKDETLVATLRLVQEEDAVLFPALAIHAASLIMHVELSSSLLPQSPSGAQLLIPALASNAVFEDLDEILVRVLEPFLMLYRQLFTHPKCLVGHAKTANDPFVDVRVASGTWVVESVLRDEKKKEPRRIPYALAPAKSQPGKFVLAWLKPTAPPKATFESISVLPLEGSFKFRGRRFTSVTDLLNFFKVDSLTMDKQKPVSASTAPGPINPLPHATVKSGPRPENVPRVPPRPAPSGNIMRTR